ncbi:peptide chain release factor N(5)-glutamine methyltransferase [Cohnella soli]|uniref:Release factor glutamine methyltransferase n=1 Tax=Cohnella soli TaxID=425005 RepID=A0ABW0HR20_9BACL
MSTERGTQTLREVWRSGAARLRQAGVEEADADAELLLLYLLGIGKTEWLRDMREPFPVEKLEVWESLLARREKGVPVQYVVGDQHFYGRAFEVTEAVLIPRPETELLAEAVLRIGDELFGPNGQGGSCPVVLDVGTGSGALSVTLAAERPTWRVIASDLSEDALAVARRNASKLGVGGKLAFVQGDLLTPFMVNGPGSDVEIDILVSNPPYIPSADIEGLQREVRDYEPRLALDGGEDGLNPYRAMAGQLTALKRLPRLVAWEVGAGQAADVAGLLRTAANWDDVYCVKDYAGIDRHVIALCK